MRIIVKAKPNAGKSHVELKKNQQMLDFEEKNQELPIYKVSVKESPVNNKANDAIIKALAKHFMIPRPRIRLISGSISRTKVFEIISK